MLRSLRVFLSIVALGLSLAGSVRAACPQGDLTGDCRVDFNDVRFMADRWLDPPGSPADIVGGDGVSWGDFAALANNWGAVGDATGSLRVSISPLEVIVDGAQWRVDGGLWRDNGTTASDLTVGPHTVDFADVPGWTKPGSEVVQISEGELKDIEGTYTRQLGSLRVDIGPADAVAAGAQWRVDGGSFAQANLSGWSADHKTATFSFESSALDRDVISHLFEVRATDAAGNTNTTYASYSVYVIGDRPELGLNINGQTAVNGDAILAAPSFEVTVIVGPTRSLNTLYYSLDGNTRQTLTGINPDNAKITFAFLSPSLSDGLHKIVYEAVDSAGLVSTLEANNLIVQSVKEVSVQGVALNYPNPFNPETGSTSIAYTLSKAGNITLTIHDLMGNQLVKQTYFANANGGRVGYNEVTWNGRTDSGDLVGNGIYIYLIIADGKPIGRGKITVLKK